MFSMSFSNGYSIPAKGLESSSFVSQSLEQQLSNSFNTYKKVKFILEVVKELITEEGTFPEDLKFKVKDIVLGDEVRQIFVTETLLGVSLENTELSYLESQRLKEWLKSSVDEHIQKLQNTFKVSEMLRSSDSVPTLDVLESTQQLVTLKREFEAQYQTCNKKLMELLELLEKYKDVRLQSVPEMSDLKYQIDELKSETNYFKSQIVKQKNNINMFAQSKESLKAYMLLTKDLDESRQDFLEEIKDLELLTRQYKNVSCLEYDQVLKSYLQYKTQIHKKKLMLNICEG